MKFNPTMQGVFDPVLDKVLNPDTVGGGSAVPANAVTSNSIVVTSGGVTVTSG